MANHPKSPAKNPTGDFGQFTDFMRRLVAVPHSEIKAKLDAEKRGEDAEAEGRFPRFPRKGLEGRFSHLASHLRIGQTLSHYLRECQLEAICIVHVLPVVVAEGLLVKVAEQMKRLDAHVGSRDAALERASRKFSRPLV